MYCFNVWDTINYDFAIEFWWGFSNLIKYLFHWGFFKCHKHKILFYCEVIGIFLSLQRKLKECGFFFYCLFCFILFFTF